MISVLTPTYNRKYTIPRLYDSLKSQVDDDFEWVVVDDGSSDGTHDLIRDYQSESNFIIRYCHQSNAGKHAALNTGVGLCSGEWILIVDSDDYLDANALSLVSENLINVSNNVVGVCFRKKYIDGTSIGRELVGEVKLMTPIEAGHYYGGDLAYVFRRDVMLKCPFPVFEGERFVPELCIWNRISDFGNIWYFSGVCFYVCEYLFDGYSANFKSNLRKNPRGFAYHYKDVLFRESILIYKVKALLRLLQCWWYQLLK
jgi:hypothetical protein